MKDIFKLYIEAQSPDGQAINCNTEIKISCDRTMSIGVIANFLNQEPKLKLLFMEAMLLALSDVKVAEPMSSDEFLDNILKSKEESE
jgi:hypothetical protein